MSCHVTYRVCVYNRWHSVVVYVASPTHHTLRTNDALVLGLVGKHGAMDTVPNGIDTVGGEGSSGEGRGQVGRGGLLGYTGLEVWVHIYSPFIVSADANILHKWS